MDCDLVVRILGQGQVVREHLGRSARPPADEGGGEHATKPLVPEVTIGKIDLAEDVESFRCRNPLSMSI